MSELSDSARDEITKLFVGSLTMPPHIKDILNKNAEITREIQDHLQRSNFQKALDTANHGIDFIEDAMENNPTDKKYLGPSLVEHIAWRSNVFSTQAIAAGTNKNTKKELLNRALADVDKALSFPKEYYISSEFRSQLEDRRKAIKEAQSDCFIATATYGSVFAPEITILRQFRDTELRQNRLGRWTIRTYEQYSPPLANLISKHSALRVWVRRLVLAPIVWFVHRRAS